MSNSTFKEIEKQIILQSSNLENLKNLNNISETTKSLLTNLFNSTYLQNVSIFQTQFSQSRSQSQSDSQTQQPSDDEIMNFISKQISKNEIYDMFLYGLSFIYIFIQTNFTGPTLDFKDKNFQGLPVVDENVKRRELMIDGELFNCKVRKLEFFVYGKIIFDILENKIKNIEERLISFYWWKLRILRIYLLFLTHYQCPTIQMEVEKCEKIMLKMYGDESEEKDKELKVRMFLELGIVNNLFLNSSKGREFYNKAKECSGLKIELTGKLGVRTKYQENPISQLTVIAKSGHSEKEGKEDKKEKKEIPKVIKLDDENILLENVKYKDKQVEMENKKNLKIIDQCIILSLCLDVKNNNPKNGLTTEKMFPYVKRVLKNPNNWLVHTMGLLIKSRLEFEGIKTMERAVLQLEQLVLQFREDEEPGVNERMKFFYQLDFPSIFYLKKELGSKFMQLGCISSGLEIYEELEVYEEIIKCYVVLGKEKKAIKIIRQRLKVEENNPELWCLLGGIEGNKEHMEKAWEVSKGKYAKAMRMLGKYYVKNNQYSNSIGAFEKAVSLNSLYEKIWFLLGCSYMRIKSWKKASNAFTHVIQIDPTDGEAWTNLSSVYYEIGELRKSFTALKQGLRYREKNGKMWYNILIISMKLHEYNESIIAIKNLASLSKDMVDYDIIKYLVNAAISGKLKDDEFFKKRVFDMLENIEKNITPEPVFWDIFCFYYIGCNEIDNAIIYKQKYIRNLKTQGWERIEKHFNIVAKSVLEMIEIIKSHVKSEDDRNKYLSSAKMEINQIIGRSEDFFSNEKIFKDLVKIVNNI